MRLKVLLVFFLTMPTVAAADLLPFAAGNAWTYEAQVDWTKANSNEVASGVVTWRSRVVEAGKTDAGTVAIVTGLPMQLGFYEPGSVPTYDVLVQDSRGLWIADAGTAEEAASIAANAAAGAQTGEQVLQYPVRLGNCASRAPGRSDNMYCWLVESELECNGLQGWRIVYRSLSSYEALDVFPEIGITGYVFRHHGTVANTAAGLISYTINGRQHSSGNALQPICPPPAGPGRSQGR
jgi:hypothetical protein